MTNLAIGTHTAASNSTAQIDSVLPSSVTASKTLALFTDIFTAADPTSGNVVLTLPDCASNPGAIFGVKRVVNGGNYVSLTPGGSDTIDGGGANILGNANEYIQVMSGGGTDWLVLCRRTFAFAALGLETAAKTPSITAAYGLYDIFNLDSHSTPGRVIADAANDKFSVLDIQGSVVDGYKIAFSGAFRYANGADVDFAVFVDGVQSSVGGHFTGRGANDVPMAIGGNIPVLVSGGTPQDIDMRIKASSDNTLTVQIGVSFTVDRIGG